MAPTSDIGWPADTGTAARLNKRPAPTSSVGREVVAKRHLLEASEEPILSIEQMGREIDAAERRRRRVARVSKVRRKHVAEHVGEIQTLRRAEQYDGALGLLFERIAATTRADEMEHNEHRDPAWA
ncbi:hypothetical protein C5B95_07330 [Rathayibacter sp. AY1A7]|nr:hypothetical protein C5B95_07330 [Rathayibacter sp. AY1A7]